MDIAATPDVPAGSSPPAPAAPAEAVRPLLRGWLHVAALAFFVVAGPLLAYRASGPGDSAALSVYVASMVALFAVSAGFHRITWSPGARRRMRRADHTSIFVAIAGTYTAVAGLILRGWAQILVLCLVWVGAAGGVAMRQMWLDAPKWAVALPYVVVGWSALAVIPQLYRSLSGGGFALLSAGGLAYSAGAVVYALKKPDPVPGVFGYHEVFHLCTIVGATLHYCAISVYALARA